MTERTLAVPAKEVTPGDRVQFLRRPSYVVDAIELSGRGVRHVHNSGAEDWEPSELCLVSRREAGKGGAS